MITLHSKIDDSVNFVDGDIEARYVRRSQSYFTCYLSSQGGCKQACRMCHLTATGQTNDRNLNHAEILKQADVVLEYYLNNTAPAERVNFAFMARGEPLANPGVDDMLLMRLMEKADYCGLVPRVSISTIFPKDIDIVKRFSISKPDIYYSLYSLDPAFRKKWLPKAIDPDRVRSRLKTYAEIFKKIPVLHWAFISGENDSLDQVSGICDWLGTLRVDFNIVGYNPPDSNSKESDRVEYLANHLRFRFPASRVKVVSRVGYDVNASCGMFNF